MSYQRIFSFGRILLLMGFALIVPSVLAADKDLKPSQQWRGSIDNEDLQKEAPTERFIVDQKAFAKLWTDWKLGDKVPEVDFKKDLVLVETTRGSVLRVTVRLKEDGDLQSLGAATRDLRSGFRYQVLVVPREGVKTVNGKELPKGD